MELDPHDPAVHIARDRLGITVEQLTSYHPDAFRGMQNAEIRYAAYYRLLHNNWEQIRAELRRMAASGITIAEFYHAGSPESFPYKVLNGGSVGKVISVVTPADSRKGRVNQLVAAKAEASKQKILSKQEAANKQLARSHAETERIRQICHEEGQRAKDVAYEARKKNVAKQQKIAESLYTKLNSADERITLYQYRLEVSNRERSAYLRVRMQQAQETAYGLGDQAKQAKQQRLQELKRYMAEREYQRSVIVETTRSAVAANCKLVKDRAEKGKSQIQQRINTLTDKVQYFEAHHDDVVQYRREELLQNATYAGEYFNAKHAETVTSARQIKQTERELKAFQATLKTERVGLNIEGSGSRLQKEHQLIRAKNECEDEKARLMRERIAARIAYKKSIYDYFNSNVPFTM